MAIKKFSFINYLGILVISCAFSIGHAETKQPSVIYINSKRFNERLFAQQVLKNDNKKAVVALLPRDATTNAADFTLKEIQIYGNRLFSDRELLEPFEGMLNKVISAENINQMITAIRTRYHNAGYILAEVSAAVAEGVLHLKVGEGHLANISVRGDILSSTAELIYRYAARLKNDSAPLAADQLLRVMLLIDNLPGIDAKATLAETPHQFGYSDLTIEVTRKPRFSYLSVDNRGSRIYGPQEYSASSYFNSWWGANQTAVQGALTQNTNQLRYIQLSHLQYVGDQGWNIYFYGSVLVTNPGSIYREDNYNGYTRAVGATLSYPLLRSLKHNIYVYTSLDALNKLIVQRSVDEVSSDDRVRSIRLGVNYEFIDGWDADGLMNFQLSKGIDGFGASKSVPSNEGGEINFTKIELGFFRTQYLIGNFSFHTGLRGQYTQSTLLTSEQIGFGGGVFGRGYDPAELLGDQGTIGRAELRYEMYPRYRLLSYVQLFTFYDAGLIWNHNDEYQEGRESATSTGVGTRFRLNQYLRGSLEMNIPLTHTIYLEQDRNPRAYFTVTASF